MTFLARTAMTDPLSVYAKQRHAGSAQLRPARPPLGTPPLAHTKLAKAIHIRQDSQSMRSMREVCDRDTLPAMARQAPVVLAFGSALTGSLPPIITKLLPPTDIAMLLIIRFTGQGVLLFLLVLLIGCRKALPSGYTAAASRSTDTRLNQQG